MFGVVLGVASGVALFLLLILPVFIFARQAAEVRNRGQQHRQATLSQCVKEVSAIRGSTTTQLPDHDQLEGSGTPVPIEATTPPLLDDPSDALLQVPDSGAPVTTQVAGDDLIELLQASLAEGADSAALPEIDSSAFSTTSVLDQPSEDQLLEDELFELSEIMLLRLPREIRDMIYTYVFDTDEILRETHRCAIDFINNPSDHCSQEYWPAFICPGKIDPTIRAELVRRFCEMNTSCIGKAQDLKSLLKQDLFHTHVSMWGVALSGIILLIDEPEPEQRLDSRDFIDYFGTLAYYRKLTKHFLLRLVVCTPITLTESLVWGDFDPNFLSKNSKVRAMNRHLMKLYYTLRSFMECWKTEWPKRGVEPVVGFLQDGEPLSSSITLREEMLMWNGMRWWKEVSPLLRETCRRTNTDS